MDAHNHSPEPNGQPADRQNQSLEPSGQTPASNSQTPEPQQRQFRGLYRHVKISVRSLNIIIIVGIIALVLCIAFAVKTGGYTVTFDALGGTSVPGQELQYGDKIEQPEPPTREGYAFGGWYTDEALTTPWNFSEDIVSGDVELYAKWIPNSE